MNNNLEIYLEEAIGIYQNTTLVYTWRDWIIPLKTSNQDSPGQDPNRPPSEHEFKALPLDQSLRRLDFMSKSKLFASDGDRTSVVQSEISPVW
jgi:hypothetical protein